MIEEIKKICDALRQKKISHDTWFFIDLDNTVMESQLELGGDLWFNAMIKYAKDMFPDDKRLAFETVIIIYHELQAHVRTKPVEKEIVDIIRAIQDIGMPIIAITARDESIRPATEKQLQDIGIDFSRNVPADIPEIGHGVIYCCGQSKGAKLKEFFAKIQRIPAHIACFDDKGLHLEDQLKTAIESNVRFNGWRYGFLDEKMKTFDFKITHQQLALIKDRLPLRVQQAIERLKIIPNDHEMTLTPTQCHHGFFHHDRAPIEPRERHHQNPRLQRHHSDSCVDYSKEQDMAIFEL